MVCVSVCLCVPAAVICSSGFSTASSVRGGHNNKEAAHCYTSSVVCLCPTTTQVVWSACMSVYVYLLQCYALQNSSLHHVCVVDITTKRPPIATQVVWSACLSVCVYLLQSDALQNSPLHHVCMVDITTKRRSTATQVVWSVCVLLLHK